MAIHMIMIMIIGMGMIMGMGMGGCLIVVVCMDLRSSIMPPCCFMYRLNALLVGISQATPWWWRWLVRLC